MLSCLARTRSDAEGPGPMSDATFCFVLNSPPRLVSVGEDVEWLLGYRRKEFLTAKVKLADRLHPEDAGLAETLFSKDSTKMSGAMNLRIRHADGRIRCLRARYAKAHARGGAFRVELWMEDARKVSEPGDAILIASFKSLIEATNDFVYVKNCNHVILAASRSLPNITESAKHAAELVGKTDYDIHPEAVADAAYRLENRAIAEGKRVNELVQLRIQDGSQRWIDNRKYPINGPGGEIIGVLGIAPDITEYREATARLRESEESLREAQKIGGLGNYSLDIPSGVWTSSEVMDEIFGIDPADEHTVGGWLDLIHDDDRAAMRAYFEDEVLRRGKAFDKEYRIVRRCDGGERWVHGIGRLTFDAQGRPVKMHGTIHDITGSKHVETALRESKELLQLFIRHAPVCLAMFDREMRYVAASRRWLQENGVAEQEIIGRCHYEVVPGLPARWKEMHRRGLAGESMRSDEDSVERGDGSTMWLRWEVIPWRTAMGEVGGIILFTEDITEWKRAQTELVRSRELLQLFVEHAPVALAMFDREMRYLALSRRWAEDHSLDWQQIVGRSHYEVNPEVPERWKETHRRGLAGETQRIEEDRYERANGTMQWIRWQIIPWRASDGSVGGIVMFYEDITERKLAEAALNESKNLLQLFIDHAPAALAMLDREMRYVAASRRWLTMHSLGDINVIGRSHYELFPRTPESWREEHRRCLAGEKIAVAERELMRADGSVQWIRREVLPWHAGDGSVGGIVILSEDISERRQAEERLRLAATVFTSAREGIMITDPAATILEVNDAFTRITGYTREEVLGKNPRILQSGLQSGEFYKNMWELLGREGHWSGELWNRTKGGEIYAATLTIDAIRDAAGQVKQYVGLSTDITEVKEHEQQLEVAAHYDALTGLPNRALFVDRLRHAMAQAHRGHQLLGVVYFDLDGFKAINDAYGHSSGDALLTALSFRMKHALREEDTLARLGGDEFAAVILDLPDGNTCLPTLTRMLEAATEEVQIGDVTLRVTASAGAVFYPQAEEVDADTLLRQAGQALYEAKLAGKNRYAIFDSSQDLMARSRHENIARIRRALAAEELVNYYQPKVNMRTGKVIGAEALLRWQHPERGLLPPGLFLPVIEDHPLLAEVGDWVIERALAQMEAWQENGFDIPVSVNVSAFELQQPDFVSRLRARLAAHPRVKPSQLELEVLETSALQDVVLSSKVLGACREAGIRISVDDFGTGYSSLIYLKRLPADILKIDQSFVRDMPDELENLSILKGILGLAEAFRRQVIAEGVETVEHGLMLLQLGCDCAQGYGIARPMPAGEFEAWAAGWHTDPRWKEVPVVHANNRAVLFAMVEHRAWYGHFLANLQGTRPVPPPLDAESCSLSTWLDSQRLSSGGLSPSMQAIENLHQQVHALAAEIYEAQARGRKQDGLGLLRQLRYLHERCMKRLQPFTRISFRKSAGNMTMRHGAAHPDNEAA